MAVLEGLKVLDLTWGIAGPMTGMLLADHGAAVTKIEPPDGDPWRRLSGYVTWQRGKRSAFLDLKSDEDRQRLLALAREADILLESFEPGVTERLGIDFAALSAVNPRLIYCSFTGYGPDGPEAGRPGIDALVAARTGQQWETRGLVGGTLARLAGVEGMMPGLHAPEGCWVGPDRDGPLFGGVPWASMATFYVASIGINAALHARTTTGRGQLVNASLLHGVLATTIGAWQQVEKTDVPFFQTWIFDPRAPKGFFRASDGKWTHHWVPLPEFILAAAESGMKPTDAVRSPKDASMRVGTSPEDMVVLHAFQDQLAEAVARYPSEDWTRLAGEVGVPVQTVRSPEQALLDPLLLEDGCVVEVVDTELGAVRQVGRVIDMPRHPMRTPTGAARPGQHTAEVIAEADAIRATPHPQEIASPRGSLASPLEGITVLDFGLAVAGPFGTQVLAQLGARVIKINTVVDKYWFTNHIAMCCNRDKDSITLNLKDPASVEIVERLVAKADVVQHNMRYDAAQRLGIDYESLIKINPRLVYCHTIGHEQGPREAHPGNDQTAAALAGTTWLDGGLDHEGRPVWSNISLGDTGNGFLSALGVIQALHERQRTGEGQFLRTSILYAHLLNASTAWITSDGERKGPRQQLDAEQLGWSALYRLYETSDGWICIAVLGQKDFEALCAVLGRPDLMSDARFSSAERRAMHDAHLAAELADVFIMHDASAWRESLEEFGIACEIADPDYIVRLFEDEDAERRGLVASFRHPVVGQMKMAGLYFDLSDTPGKIWGPPVWPGANTRQILGELGYSEDEIEKLCASGVVEDTSAG